MLPLRLPAQDRHVKQPSPHKHLLSPKPYVLNPAHILNPVYFKSSLCVFFEITNVIFKSFPQKLAYVSFSGMQSRRLPTEGQKRAVK